MMHIYCLLLLCLTLTTQARMFNYTKGTNHQMIGSVQTVQAQPGDTLESIAYEYDIGFDELLHANWAQQASNVLPGTQLTLPTQYILPDAPHTGIVVNLAEKRLYYFVDSDHVLTYPVGIGRLGWATPTGKVYIANKHANPSWHVPESVREAQAEAGNLLPKVVPPGPKNPLGHYALRLSKSNYLIHGTNNPDGVGKRSSAGCLRMYPKDIQDLFNRVKINTPVLIINQSIKLAKANNHWFLESHVPLQELANDKNLADGVIIPEDLSLADAHDQLMNKLTQQHIMTEDFWVEFILQESSGLPTPLPTTQDPQLPPKVILKA